MTATFQKKVENFTCQHCGYSVTGNGYTNHCPKCLWSRHVDRYPGDRANECQAMMSPVGWTKERQVFFVVHCCERCGFSRRNRLAENDSMDALIHLPQGMVY